MSYHQAAYAAANNSPAPYNSSVTFLERIERRWDEAQISKRNGDSLAYFRSLENIYLSTQVFFTKEEFQACYKMIKLIEANFKNAALNSSTSYGNGAAAGAVFIAENMCDELHIVLSRLLVKYKLSYYKRGSLDPLEEIERDFGEYREKVADERLDINIMLQELEDVKQRDG